MSQSNTTSTNGRLYKFNPASNTFQQPYIKWKGKTFTQIFSMLKKNNNSFNTLSPAVLRNPLPQKLIRKEFGNIPKSEITQSQRTSIKIDELDMPNGSFITTINNPNGSLSTTLDMNYIHNLTEHPKTCASFSNGKSCMTTEYNARHRVRSAGMYPKKFDLKRNNDSVYHSSTNNYLVSRSRTFQQNQYQYFRNGTNRQYKVGENHQSYFNDYSPQGIQHCLYGGDISTTPFSQQPHTKVVYKPNNWKFATQGAVDSSALTSHKKEVCDRGCFIVEPRSFSKKQFPHTQLNHACRKRGVCK
jgi:hypothetical protein